MLQRIWQYIYKILRKNGVTRMKNIQGTQLELQIPEAVNNLQLPTFQAMNYWQLAENRIFFIDAEEIESFDLLEIAKSILAINIADKGIEKCKRKPITLCIFTYGGDLSGAYSLIDTMLSSTTPIRTINFGLAMSAGLLILLAGEERFCFKRSQALVHTGSGGLQGTYEQIEESQKNYKKMVDDMKDYILSRSTIDEKLFNKNKSKDWYLSSDEQIKYNICTNIIENLDEIL